MKIILVVSDSWLFKPRFVETLFDSRASDFVLVGLTPAKFRHLSWMELLKKHWILLGCWGFLSVSFLTFWFRISDQFARRFSLLESRSVRTVCIRHGVSFQSVDDINSRDFLDEVQRLQPDLILNLGNQIFRKEILSIPRLGCVNKHCSLLPEYAGMYPTFWALLNGEDRVGATVHFMDERLDAGDIIRQEEIPVPPGATVMGLWEACYQLAARLTLEVLEDLEAGKAMRTPMPQGGSYHSFPERADVETFLERGLRIRRGLRSHSVLEETGRVNG